MRYTIAAFGIMASAVFAVPMATDGHVVARGSGDDADDWKDWGYTSSDDWKKKGGWKDYATWKKHAEDTLPWESSGSWDDWWDSNGYDWWHQISGDDDSDWKGKDDFDDWFKKTGYKTNDYGKDGDWFQDKSGVGWHKKNGKWVQDESSDNKGYNTWGETDPEWEDEYDDDDSSDWSPSSYDDGSNDDDDNDWYQDSTGQGWHKSKSGKWVKDSSDDSKKWKKGSDGKWTSYEEGKH